MTLEAVLACFRGVRRNGSGWCALCPSHDDRKPSLSIDERDGKVLLHCHAGCSLEAICAAAGLEVPELFAGNGSAPRVVAEYDYRDENGEFLFQVVRFEPKDFRQRRRDGNGRWIWNLNGMRRVIYRLPEVLAADEVLVCEGEKDCETAHKLGLVATCNPGGAGKWRNEYSEVFPGKRVAIIADADEPGRRHAQQVAVSLAGKVSHLKLLELPGAKDVTEWKEHGGTKEALLELARNASEWKPEPKTPQVVQLVAESDWPDPTPLGDELPPVPAFDLELLPASFRPQVEDVSERMQTPLDYAAATSIVALAGCVNRRAIIFPKRQDKAWGIVLNLWGAIIAPPGAMKSPVLHAITRPLTLIEAKWHAEYEKNFVEFKRQQLAGKLRQQAGREQFKSAVKKGHTAQSLEPEEDLEEPTQKRLLLTDSTYEKLHEILSQNPAGVLVLRDELTGWLAGLDRLGREGERGFYLQAWSGDDGYAIDRIGRGSIYVPHVCVSLLGNIQPTRLRSYLSEVIAGGPNDDGLFQRFQILVWPDLPRKWKLVDRPANDTALQVVERVFQVLADLSADDPVRMHFASDAQELFLEWWTELEGKLRGDSALAPSLVAHFAKYRSLMPTLAGLFELADRAAEGEGVSAETQISLQHTRQAAAFCEYLEAHANRVYSCIVSPQLRAARDLAGHIRQGALPATFTTRTVYLKGWTGLDEPEKAQAALRLLEDAGWVRHSTPRVSESGGRPSELWNINPKVKHHGN